MLLLPSKQLETVPPLPMRFLKLLLLAEELQRGLVVAAVLVSRRLLAVGVHQVGGTALGPSLQVGGSRGGLVGNVTKKEVGRG